MTEQAKHAADIAAGSAVVAAWLDWLPQVLEIVVLILTAIWFALRIWESETVKRMTGRYG